MVRAVRIHPGWGNYLSPDPNNHETDDAVHFARERVRFLTQYRGDCLPDGDGEGESGAGGYVRVVGLVLPGRPGCLMIEAETWEAGRLAYRRVCEAAMADLRYKAGLPDRAVGRAVAGVPGAAQAAGDEPNRGASPPERPDAAAPAPLSAALIAGAAALSLYWICKRRAARHR